MWKSDDTFVERHVTSLFAAAIALAAAVALTHAELVIWSRIARAFAIGG